MDAAILEELLKQTEVPLGPEPGWESRLQTLVRGEVKLNEGMKRYTSIQIGGRADALVFPADLEDLGRVIIFARENRVPWTVLGLGSNVLVRDGGIRGIVLKLNKTLDKIERIKETDEEVLLEVGAGVPLPKLVEQGRQEGWQGVEPLYGIPGSVGGAIWMNAGTREGEIKNCVTEVSVLLSDGTRESFSAEKLKFEYRHLKLPAKGVILSGKFYFTKIDPRQVQEKIAVFQQKRRETQPLDQPSLGSVFKNPEKGCAAQWIEELGLKGIRVGGARISEKHANFIVNEKEATAHDVLALIGLVRDRVREEYDYRLELEAKILGEDEPV